MSKAQKAYDALPDDDPRKAEARPFLEAARHNWDLVDTVSAVHNTDYAMELVDKTSEDAGRALRIAKQARKKAPASRESR